MCLPFTASFRRSAVGRRGKARAYIVLRPGTRGVEARLSCRPTTRVHVGLRRMHSSGPTARSVRVVSHRSWPQPPRELDTATAAWRAAARRQTEQRASLLRGRSSQAKAKAPARAVVVAHIRGERRCGGPVHGSPLGRRPRPCAECGGGGGGGGSGRG